MDADSGTPARVSGPAPVTRSIRVVKAGEIGADPRGFYEEFAREPVVVKEVYDHLTELRALDWDGLTAMFAGGTLKTYDAQSFGEVAVAASEVFDGARGGPKKFNIVDHSVVGEAFGKMFEVAPFLRHNWIVGLLPGMAHMEKSLTVSPAGNFTSLHVDGYGMQGWMYLIQGHKSWELFPPRDIPLLFDPTFREFFDPRQPDPERYPYAEKAEKWAGDAGAGDLLYFPSSWAHQVWTHEPSFGFGGSVINDFQVMEETRCWLWERTLRMQGGVDFARLLAGIPPDRCYDEAGFRRTRAALELCRTWEARMRELGIPVE